MVGVRIICAGLISTSTHWWFPACRSAHAGYAANPPVARMSVSDIRGAASSFGTGGTLVVNFGAADSFYNDDSGIVSAVQPDGLSRVPV